MQAVVSQRERIWRGAFLLYGVLSLSSMAGMGIGSGIFFLCSLVFFLGLPRDERRARLGEVLRTPYTWISVGLFFCCALSLASALLFPVEGSLATPSFTAIKKFHYFLYPPLFAAAFLATPAELEHHRFWRFWGFTGALLGVIALTQYFGASLFPAAWLERQYFRPIGETGHFHGQGLMFFHLSFASCMGFVAAMGMSRIVFPREGDGWRARGFWLCVALLGGIAVFLSYSRIAFVALGLMMVLLGFLKRPKWGLVFAAAISGVGYLVWMLSPVLQERFHQSRGNWFERQSMWRTAWEMFLERPIAGVGFGRTGELSPHFVEKWLKLRPDFTSHAHNNLLDMMASTGLLGTLAFALWFGFLFWAALRAFLRAPEKERWLPAACLLGFTAFHINGITQVNFWDGKSQHTLMVFAGLALALWVRGSLRQSR